MSNAPAPIHNAKRISTAACPSIFSIACTRPASDEARPAKRWNVAMLEHWKGAGDPSLSVLNGRIAEEMFAVYAIVEEGHVGCYPSGLVLVEHSAEMGLATAYEDNTTTSTRDEEGRVWSVEQVKQVKQVEQVEQVKQVEQSSKSSKSNGG